jgi:hypothetical protein
MAKVKEVTPVLKGFLQPLAKSARTQRNSLLLTLGISEKAIFRHSGLDP